MTTSRSVCEHTLSDAQTTAAMIKTMNVEIVAIRPKKRHYYPNSGQEHKYAPNLLKREFYPENHNTHWVGDITLITL